MSDTQIQRSTQYVWEVYAFAVVGSGILTPLVLSQYGYPPLKVLFATMLLGICLYPTIRYFANKERGLPTFPVLCLAYTLLFAVPVFTREPAILLANGQTAFLDEEDVVMALLLSILGVSSLVIGYYGFQVTRLARNLPTIVLHLDEKRAIVYCVAMGFLAPILARPENILPESILLQLSAIIRVLQSQVLVAIAILAYLIYSGRGPVWYRALLYWIIGTTVILGLSNGMMEQAVTPIAVLVIMRWQLTKRLPIRSIIALTLFIVFLSPVKQGYRRVAWYEDVSIPDSSIGRAFFWVHQASQYWSDTFTGQRSISESTEHTASRLDLIHQFALVRSLTPSEIPYQYGETYSYFLVTFIPRAVWPEKPEAGAANKFFAVNYGITTEEGAKQTTFGVSLLAESYINFGWVGIIFIMALQGAVLGLLQYLFGEQKSGEGGWAVYVSVFVFFLNGIGSSTDMLFGNVFQIALLSSFLLRWMRAKPSTRSSRETQQSLLTSVQARE